MVFVGDKEPATKDDRFSAREEFAGLVVIDNLRRLSNA